MPVTSSSISFPSVIEYTISKLSNNYKIKENVIVGGKKYADGTYVWNMFKREKFYSELLKDLDEYLDFIKVVIGSENGGTEDFKRYFQKDKGGFSESERIRNAHTILNSILRNDDMVPKMMAMKYFLEVLLPEKVKDNEYKVIYYINVIATVFSLSNKRKNSESIAARLLQIDWQQEL